MRVCLYQMKIIPGDPEANRKKVRQWIKRVVTEEQPDTIVLPEMWTTGYTLPQLKNIADRDGGPTTSLLRELAIKYQINVIGGSFANIKNGDVYNSAVVINRQGEVVYHYDKVHLVPMLDEHMYLKGGQHSHIFELEGIKMGLIICYDLRFPELARSLALAGAQILFIVAEWPDVRKEHWKYLQIARAIENQMYIVSANCVGSYNDHRFCGQSMIIDPWGEVLQCCSEDEEQTVTQELDLDKVSRIRAEVPVFQSRVPSVYKIN